jgi:hypothetical protein
MLLLLLLLVCEGGTQTSTHHRPCTDYSPRSFTTAFLREEREEMAAFLEAADPVEKARGRKRMYEWLMPDFDRTILVNEDPEVPESIKHSYRLRSCGTIWFFVRGGSARLKEDISVHVKRVNELLSPRED